MRRKILLVLASTFLMVGSGVAQRSVSLNLEEAIEIALTDNPTIKVAEMEIERQNYVKKETLGNLYPSLSANVGFRSYLVQSTIDMPNTAQSTMDGIVDVLNALGVPPGNFPYLPVGGPESMEISMMPKNTLYGGMQLSLPIYAPAIYRSLKLNDEQMKGAVESARASKIDMVCDVKKSYHNILMAQEALKVLKSSEELIQKTVDQTRAMFDSGLVSEYDLLTAQVQLSNLQPMIIETENMIKVAKLLFKMYLMLPADVDVELEDDLTLFAENVEIPYTTAELDLSENTNLKTFDIQHNMLKHQLSVLKTQRLPTVTAFSQFDPTYQTRVSFGDVGGSKYQFQYPVLVGVQMSIPIFAGFTNVNKEKQLKNSISQLEVQRTYLESSVNLQVKSAITELEKTKGQMAANEFTVGQAQKAYTIASARYLAGAGTILELNNSELAVTQAKMNYYQAMCNLLNAEADYYKTLGVYEEAENEAN